MTQKSSGIRTVTIRDLGRIFVQRFVIILLVMALSMGALFIADRITYEPEYSSTATLYILKQENSTNSTDTNTDFSLALSVVNDCTYLLKSHMVLDEVIEKLGLDLTYEELYNRVSARNPDDTRVLEVSVTADTPENAKEIVDEICSIGSDSIEDAMGFRQVNLYEKGTLETQPCNRTSLKTYAVVGLIAGLLTYLVFIVIFMLDDRLRTNEDIEKALGVSILGEIPNANHTHKGKYGYYGHYYKAYGKAYGQETGGRKKRTGSRTKSDGGESK